MKRRNIHEQRQAILLAGDLMAESLVDFTRRSTAVEPFADIARSVAKSGVVAVQKEEV